MSISTQIERIRGNITNAYSAIESKGGTLPETQNSNNLATAIESIGQDTLQVVTFADGTDEEIAAMLDAHYQGKIDIADYWAVGDTRKIHLNSISNPLGSNISAWEAQDITIVITAMKHYNLGTSINGVTKAAIVCQTKQCVNDNNSSSNQTTHIYPQLQSQELTDESWSGSNTVKLRLFGNTFYNDALPVNIRNMIKTVIRTVKTDHAGTTTTTAWDKVFLPTATEIFNSSSLTNVTEGTQWEYYKTSSNRIKYGNNNGNNNSTKQRWWTGSPGYSNAYWCNVDTDGTESWGQREICIWICSSICNVTFKNI